MTLIQNARPGVGVLGVVVSAASKTFLHTAFPVAAQGIAHRVRILKVHESSFGLEACITASIGEAKINFFDPYYALCWDLCRPGVEIGQPNPQSPGHLAAPSVIDVQARSALIASKPVEFIGFDLWYFLENT